jgi:hypothetical protein
MKRNMGLLSVLLGVGGMGMLLLSGTLGLGIVTMIGIVMVMVGIVGGLVSTAIEEDRDSTSWATRSDDGLQKPTMDKEQLLPLGGYGPRA